MCGGGVERAGQEEEDKGVAGVNSGIAAERHCVCTSSTDRLRLRGEEVVARSGLNHYLVSHRAQP